MSRWCAAEVSTLGQCSTRCDRDRPSSFSNDKKGFSSSSTHAVSGGQGAGAQAAGRFDNNCHVTSAAHGQRLPASQHVRVITAAKRRVNPTSTAHAGASSPPAATQGVSTDNSGQRTSKFNCTHQVPARLLQRHKVCPPTTVSREPASSTAHSRCQLASCSDTRRVQ
jgi:hypothetical protein